MKKMILLSLTLSTLIFANENASLLYAQKEKREFPTQQEFILSYNNVLENVRQSVVNIATQKSVTNQLTMNPFMNDPLFREFFRGYNNDRVPKERLERALGSGVVISENGYIVTNNHVIDGADKIVVTLPGDTKEYEAKLIGKDKKSDLAIIKIDAKELHAITFYDSEDVKVGDIVFAIGNPFGVGETITQGIVSATKRDSVGITEYENFIQTDASINPGNSGGALINSAGYLVGINSAIISQSGGNVGIGFAIPSNMVSKIALGLIDNGEYKRAYLGVSISNVTSDMSSFYDGKSGALITGIEENTPAKEAELKRGDLIVSVDGKSIKSASELKNTIGNYTPDTTISLEIIRDKKKIFKKILLSSQSKASNALESYNGLEVEEITALYKKDFGLASNVSGVIITEIAKDSDAQRVQLQRGDIIIQIEDMEIHTLQDFEKATKTENKKRFYIYRQGVVFVVVL